MLKIPSKYSTTISIIITSMFAVCCLAGFFMVPYLANLLVEINKIIKPYWNGIGIEKSILIVAFYCVLADCLLISVLILKLLFNVRKQKVFSEQSISLIRAISWCCFFFALCFAAIGLIFQLSFAVVFVAVMLGLCLRVVKNVIEEATEIKSENDLTV